MKILFAIKSMDYYTGGAERVLAEVAGGLAKRGHDVSLLSFDAPGGAPVYPLPADIGRVCLGIGDITRPARFKETLQRMVALRRAVKHEKPDIAVAFMHSMFVPMAFALIGTGIPVIASEHIVPQHYQTRPLEFFFLKLSRFSMKKITVLSDAVKALYPRALQRCMVVMPNPVNTPQGLAKAGADVDPKIILCVGRLEEQKNQGVLVRAFAELANEFPEWQLRIIGEGGLRGELERLVTMFHLEDRIFLPGTTRDIAAEYRAAHIFALPSSYESFGLATAEALIHGLPAIGFVDCPGTNELIRSGHSGYLVNSDKPVTRFAAALRRLMDDDILRAKMGETARRSVPQYQHHAVIDQWENLLKTYAS